MTTPAVPGGVLAIDAGNSKTDIALVAPDGSVLGTARGGGFHPHILGAGPAVAGLVPVVAATAEAAGVTRQPGVPLTEHVSACLANADLPIEEERLQTAIEAQRWGVTVAVANDTFALLRAGVEEPKGVVVVCGAGINCAGLRPDGRTARFPAVGALSGDWGGGMGLAAEALWHAARADDGRGPHTELMHALPAHFGLAGMPELIEALHLGEIPAHRRLELTPILFDVAAAGDDIAVSLVRRQAEEIVTMATVALRRLDLLGEPTDLVFGGGVLTAGHPQLMETIAELLSTAAPKAVTKVVREPPVLGAALLGLDRIGAAPAVQARLRAAFG
jgi:N-acetylglucosamine kinase-like BadF-type ATPase